MLERGKDIQAKHMSVVKYPVYSLPVCVVSSVSSLCMLLGICLALPLAGPGARAASPGAGTGGDHLAPEVHQMISSDHLNHRKTNWIM